MASPKANVIEAGAGRPVLCLHSSLGSSRQWLALMEKMAPHARIIAPDLYGHGASPSWPGPGRLRLDDELALLEPVLQRLGTSFDLVGHSYGAAVATRLALRHPSKIRTLVLYEPVLFSMLRLDHRSRAAAEEIDRLRRDLEESMARDDAARAAQRFIDYWSGHGAWNSSSRERQRRYASGMPAVMHNFATADTDCTLLRHYRSLQTPTLLLEGTASPISTRRIIELLSSLLPNAEVRSLPGLGHMGPVTHALTVNELIRSFQWTSRGLATVA